jgi:hypothetical protein
MTTALAGMSGQQHAPAVLTPGKDPVPTVQEAWLVVFKHAKETNNRAIIWKFHVTECMMQDKQETQLLKAENST